MFRDSAPNPEGVSKVLVLCLCCWAGLGSWKRQHCRETASISKILFGAPWQQQMHHRALWDQANFDKPLGLPWFSSVCRSSSGRFSIPVMEKQFKEILRNTHSYFKGSILLLFSLEQRWFQHSVIDVDPGSLLRRSVLLREAVPWGLTKRGQACSNSILSVLTNLGPALLGEVAVLWQILWVFLEAIWNS